MAKTDDNHCRKMEKTQTVGGRQNFYHESTDANIGKQLELNLLFSRTISEHLFLLILVVDNECGLFDIERVAEGSILSRRLY